MTVKQIFIVNGVNLKRFGYDLGPKEGDVFYTKHFGRLDNREVGKIFGHDGNLNNVYLEKEKRGFFMAYRLRYMFFNFREVIPGKFIIEYHPVLKEKESSRMSSELWPPVKNEKTKQKVWQAVCDGVERCT